LSHRQETTGAPSLQPFGPESSPDTNQLESFKELQMGLLKLKLHWQILIALGLAIVAD
jgi:hypothetical protein